MPSIIKRVSQRGAVTYLARARVRGGENISKTFVDRSEAKEWALEQEKEQRVMKQASGNKRTAKGPVTITTVINKYLADSKTKTLKTYEGQQQILAWFVNEQGDYRVLHYGPEQVVQARDKLAETRKPGTVIRMLAAMRTAFNYGRTLKLIPKSHEWPEDLMPSVPEGRSRFLTDDELKRLLDAAKPDQLMHAFIMAALGTGLRQGELIRLKWADVDLVKGSVTVLQSKTGKKRTVHITPAAVTALEGLKKRKVVSPTIVFLNDQGRPFAKPLCNQRWDKIRKKAKLLDFHFHDIRHTHASILAQSGATLFQIGYQLGHKRPDMTARYAHLVPGVKLPGHDELDAKLTAK